MPDASDVGTPTTIPILRRDGASGAPPVTQTRRTLPRGLRVVLQILLTVLVTWFILDRAGVAFADLADIDPSRWTLDLRALLASVVVLAAGYAMSSWLWARMVAEMGARQLPLGAAVRVYMVANLGRYVPGKVLQIAGLALFARREGVPPGTSMGAAVVGQGIALLGATLVGLGAFFGPNEAYRTVGWIGLGIAALVIGATSVPRSAHTLERLWRRLAGSPRSDVVGVANVPSAVKAQANTEDPVGRPGFGLRWTLWYTLNWGVYSVAFWLLFLGLESWAPFLQVGPAFAAAYLVGYAAVFAPAGVGVREGALIVFLLPVLTRDAAVAMAIASRVWLTVVELVPAAVFAVLEARRGSLAPESHTSDSASTR